MAEPTQKFQDACEWLAGINCPVVTDGGLSHEDGRHRLPGRYSIQPTLCNGYMSADLHRRQNRATSFIFSEIKTLQHAENELDACILEL